MVPVAGMGKGRQKKRRKKDGTGRWLRTGGWHEPGSKAVRHSGGGGGTWSVLNPCRSCALACLGMAEYRLICALKMGGVGRGSGRTPTDTPTEGKAIFSN